MAIINLVERDHAASQIPGDMIKRIATFHLACTGSGQQQGAHNLQAAAGEVQKGLERESDWGRLHARSGKCISHSVHQDSMTIALYLHPFVHSTQEMPLTMALTGQYRTSRYKNGRVSAHLQRTLQLRQP